MEGLFVSMAHECWTDDGLNNSTEWMNVRLLSNRTLQSFGWQT